MYDDNSTYCFSAKHDESTAGRRHGWLDGAAPAHEENNINDITAIAALPTAELGARGIAHNIADQYGVRVEYDQASGAEAVYYFPLYNAGQLVGYQAKRAKGPGLREKDDTWRVGETKGCDPFGAHVAGNTGKYIVVTEGAEDCLATAQLLAQLGKRYRVVATLGTDGWKRQLPYFQRFDRVVIAFDQDEGGRKAAREFSAALSIGKAAVAEWDPALGSDPNALLVGQHYGAFGDALFRAREVKPDGVISLADQWDRVATEDERESVAYPWAGLNGLTYGQRQGELVTWTAGTGIGKSAVTREITVDLLRNTKDHIGVLALEESVKRTMWGLMGVVANRPLHLIHERKGLSEEDRRKLFRRVFGGGRLYAYDHWGSTAVDNLIDKVRYMIVGLDCRWIVLDHLSIVVSSQVDNGEERRAIDQCMTALRKLCAETGAAIHLVSHLRRSDGKGHEEGAEVSLNELRGSQAIAQLSDIVVGLERNQQDPDPVIANQTRLRVLKNRYSGLTGVACTLQYDRSTGRLSELQPVAQEESSDI